MRWLHRIFCHKCFMAGQKLCLRPSCVNRDCGLRHQDPPPYIPGMCGCLGRHLYHSSTGKCIWCPCHAMKSFF